MRTPPTTPSSSIPRRRACLRLVATTLALLGAPPPGAWAQQPAESDAALYARQLGDGMRFFAQGRYPEALEQLHRAYAQRAEPTTLKLIARTYDLLGHCSAARTQLELLALLHPKELASPLQRCARPASLQIDCSPDGWRVQVTPDIQVQCGQSILLPAGQYKLLAPDLEVIKTVQLAAEERQTVLLQLRPKKWTTSRLDERSQRVSRIERLGSAEDSPYLLIMSEDGLYQVWSPAKRQVVCRQEAGKRVCSIPRLSADPGASSAVPRIPREEQPVRRVEE